MQDYVINFNEKEIYRRRLPEKCLKLPEKFTSGYVSFTAAATDMRYFLRSKFSRCLVHKKLLARYDKSQLEVDNRAQLSLSQETFIIRLSVCLT